MQDYLSELEQTKIEAFCKDEVMYNAVKKVLLQAVYSHGVLEAGKEPMETKMNYAFSLVSKSLTNPIPDELLGQNLRAMWAGLNALELGFNELQEIKVKEEVVESPYNEAI